jgi:two-component system OmpR family response regulator
MTSNPELRVSRPWTNRRLTHGNMRLRILIVDDNEDAAEALAMYLAYEAMECRVVLGGLEAIAIGCTWMPHVIFMDISMPGCDGLQAALALRANALTSGITIIAVTALDESDVRRKSIDHEFDGYFQKGQSPTGLIDLVKSFY